VNTRRTAAVIVVLACALAASFSLPGHAAAASPPAVPVHPPPTRAISWLAAGDSYSSGQGLAYEVGSCARALPGDAVPGAWGIEAGDALATQNKVKLAAGSPNLQACSGAFTSEFFQPQRPNPAEWAPADPPYDLVSFTFGGDDLGFKSVVEACLGLDPGGISSAVGLLSTAVGRVAALQAWKDDPFAHCPSNSALRAQIAQLATPYKAFLEEVAREAVTPGGNIVVLGYPDLVEEPKLWSAIDKDIGFCQGIRPADADELRGLAGDLNATIAETVTAVNAEHINGVALTYVDVNTGNPKENIPYSDPDLFEPNTGARHNLCAAKEWINGITIRIGQGTQLPSINSSFHPNQEGNDAMAGLVEQIFPQLDWSHLGTALAPTPLFGVGASTPRVAANNTVQADMKQQCAADHQSAVIAPASPADSTVPVSVVDSDAAYFDYDVGCVGSVGNLATVYVVLAPDGWHGIDVGGTQSDGVPRAGLDASIGSICSCELYVKGCADVLTAPSVTATVVGCAPTGSLAFTGGPTFFDGHMWWPVQTSVGKGWMLHEMAACLGWIDDDPQTAHTLQLACNDPPKLGAS